VWKSLRDYYQRKLLQPSSKLDDQQVREQQVPKESESTIHKEE